MTAEALPLRTLLEAPDVSPAPALFPHFGEEDYPAREAHAQETRRSLEALRTEPSRQVRLRTRSPRVLRDLDLLRRLDARHAVSIEFALSSVDSSTVRRLEGAAPGPAERLRAMAELTAAGLSATLVWAPVLPGFNDDPRAVDRLFAAARQAGAHDVELQLPQVSIVERFQLTEPVRKLFDLRGRLREAESRRLRELFARNRLAHGYPRALPGRG